MKEYRIVFPFFVLFISVIDGTFFLGQGYYPRTPFEVAEESTVFLGDENEFYRTATLVLLDEFADKLNHTSIPRIEVEEELLRLLSTNLCPIHNHFQNLLVNSALQRVAGESVVNIDKPFVSKTKTGILATEAPDEFRNPVNEILDFYGVSVVGLSELDKAKLLIESFIDKGFIPKNFVYGGKDELNCNGNAEKIKEEYIKTETTKQEIISNKQINDKVDQIVELLVEKLKSKSFVSKDFTLRETDKYDQNAVNYKKKTIQDDLENIPSNLDSASGNRVNNKISNSKVYNEQTQTLINETKLLHSNISTSENNADNKIGVNEPETSNINEINVGSNHPITIPVPGDTFEMQLSSPQLHKMQTNTDSNADASETKEFGLSTTRTYINENETPSFQESININLTSHETTTEAMKDVGSILEKLMSLSKTKKDQTDNAVLVEQLDFLRRLRKPRMEIGNVMLEGINQFATSGIKVEKKRGKTMINVRLDFGPVHVIPTSPLLRSVDQEPTARFLLQAVFKLQIDLIPFHPTPLVRLGRVEIERLNGDDIFISSCMPLEQAQKQNLANQISTKINRIKFDSYLKEILTKFIAEDNTAKLFLYRKRY